MQEIVGAIVALGADLDVALSALGAATVAAIAALGVDVTASVAAAVTAITAELTALTTAITAELVEVTTAVDTAITAQTAAITAALAIELAPLAQSLADADQNLRELVDLTSRAPVLTLTPYTGSIQISYTGLNFGSGVTFRAPYSEASTLPILPGQRYLASISTGAGQPYETTFQCSPDFDTLFNGNYALIVGKTYPDGLELSILLDRPRD